MEMHTVNDDSPCTTLMQCLCYPFRYFGRRLSKLTNQLPICACEQEDEYDVDEEEEEIFLHERVLDPAPGAIALEIRES